jgi:hypothetical protein
MRRVRPGGDGRVSQPGQTWLSGSVGAPLRLDNLQPIAQALSSDRLASPWRRDRANDALVELADVTLAKNARGLLQNTAARDGLVAIIGDLTARQVLVHLRFRSASCSFASQRGQF